MTLPRGWAIARVDELSGLGGLVTDGDWVESKDQDLSGHVRLTQLADVGDGEFRDRSARFMTLEATRRLGCTYLQPNDVLIARMPDPIGRACIFPGLSQPAVTAVDVMIWRTDGELAGSDWFAKWVNSPAVRTEMSEGAGGTTRQRIAGGRVKELTLPVPPRAEQRRIVAKLDALTARIARARAELDLAAKLADRVRQAVLLSIFGEQPQSGWETLGSLIESVEAGKNIQCLERPPSANELGIVKVSAVSSGVFRPEQSKTLPHSYLPPASHRIVAGDLLLARASGSVSLVGRAATVPCDTQNLHISDKVLRLRIKDGFQHWVSWFLKSPAARAQIVAAATGITMHNITQAALKELRIPVMEASDRLRSLDLLRATFTRADRLEAEAARARALLDRLEAAILARAFRGELVPQDPDDEPASVLLERIRARRAAAPKAKRGRRTAAAD